MSVFCVSKHKSNFLIGQIVWGFLALMLTLPSGEALAQTRQNPAQTNTTSRNCSNAIRERLNIAIGFYRVEIAASHFISQYVSAEDAPRREKLNEARLALKDLLDNLQSQLAQNVATPDANGLCSKQRQIVSNLHEALGLYSQVVHDRWVFMQNRLIILKSGQQLTGDMAEAELWVREPRARYDVWRFLAQTGQINSEASAALYVLGMLSRVEWHTAMALYSSLQSGVATAELLPPEQYIQKAIADTMALKSNWPTPSGATNNSLWANLNNIAKSLPDTRPQDIPKAAPAQGWAAWIGNWIDNYGKVFIHSIPKALSALEDAAGQ